MSTSEEEQAGSKQISSLQYMKGVGPRRAEALAAEGILTSQDLLHFYPRAYIDRNATPSLRVLRAGLQRQQQGEIFPEEYSLSAESIVVATIADVKERRFGKQRTIVIVTLDDNSGVKAEIVYFNQAHYFKKIFAPDMLVAVSGKPELNKYGRVTFHHPEVERIEADDAELYSAGRILPKYRSTQKMKNAGLNTRLMRSLIAGVIARELPKVEETLTPALMEKHSLPPLQTAIRQMHFPDSRDSLTAASKRMKFDELFYFELFLAMRQQGARITERGIAFNSKSKRARKLLEQLPFELTAAQRRVIREISSDMGAASPMNRLLQGDVGSGKTIVALLAMLVAVDNDCQSVLMAPTELLAEQHFHSLQDYVRDLDVKVVQLVGGQRSKTRRLLLEEIASGKADIIVGTHAVFESSVEYRRLGLAVIDEQHRFGVMQRARLKQRAAASFYPDNLREDPAEKSGTTEQEVMPDILVMSATPIPRTLSMTVYGDLEVSVIDELPKNRKPIQTRVVFESQLEKVYDFIRENARKGHQAYIVYPLVEKSEKMELKSASEHSEFLADAVFPDLKLGLLHGQMLWYEKEDTMRAFKDRHYDILVATTVVEVGIDVPNATLMLIENAERFGLSQLHQLRGRVGRGADQSYCLLATKDHFRFQLKRRDVEAGEQKAAIIRLKTMEETSDGFKIAEVDLQLRGPGDILGTKQSGLPEFMFANLLTDGDLIQLARNEAFEVAGRDPHLRSPENAVLRRRFRSLYQQEFGFLDIA